MRRTASAATGIGVAAATRSRPAASDPATSRVSSTPTPRWLASSRSGASQCR